MRKITEIIYHCTATKEGERFTVEDVDRWHKEKGWKGIGYHYLIGLKGELWIGRDIEEIGAHCVGHNANSIGICYVGGLDKNGKAKDTRTLEQKRTLRILNESLTEKYPEATIHGHREFANKECPCFDVKTQF